MYDVVCVDGAGGCCEWCCGWCCRWCCKWLMVMRMLMRDVGGVGGEGYDNDGCGVV